MPEVRHGLLRRSPSALSLATRALALEPAAPADSGWCGLALPFPSVELGACGPEQAVPNPVAQGPAVLLRRPLEQVFVFLGDTHVEANVFGCALWHRRSVQRASAHFN